MINSHHEQEFQTPSYAFGRVILSYPRKLLRIPKGGEADNIIVASKMLGHLMTKLADVSVSMGQPRYYRPMRLSDDKISDAVESYLGKLKLSQTLEAMGFNRLDILHQTLKDITFAGKHFLFLLHNSTELSSGYSSGYLLQHFTRYRKNIPQKPVLYLPVLQYLTKH